MGRRKNKMLENTLKKVKEVVVVGVLGVVLNGCQAIYGTYGYPSSYRHHSADGVPKYSTDYNRGIRRLGTDAAFESYPGTQERKVLRINNEGKLYCVEAVSIGGDRIHSDKCYPYTGQEFDNVEDHRKK